MTREAPSSSPTGLALWILEGTGSRCLCHSCPQNKIRPGGAEIQVVVPPNTLVHALLTLRFLTQCFVCCFVLISHGHPQIGLTSHTQSSPEAPASALLGSPDGPAPRPSQTPSSLLTSRSDAKAPCVCPTSPGGLHGQPLCRAPPHVPGPADPSTWSSSPLPKHGSHPISTPAPAFR